MKNQQLSHQKDTHIQRKTKFNFLRRPPIIMIKINMFNNLLILPLLQYLNAILPFE